MRSAFVVILAILLACPPGVFGAPEEGVVQGTVTVDGRPLSGMDLSLVNVGTGSVHTARSGTGGDFELSLVPGSYVIAGDSRAGLSVTRAPAVVRVEAGQVASADLEFVALSVPASQVPPDTPEEPGAAIMHDEIRCMLAGEFPIMDAGVEPAEAVVRARVYFRSALSDEWYFVEMNQENAIFRGWLPRPQIAASPITYYIQATTTDFGESRTGEVPARVVEFEDDCEDDPMAAYGTPPADLTVFSASTGAVAGLPTGFAVGGGLALGAGAIAALAAGAAAAGVAASQVVADDTPTPTPVPTATPIPATPTPTPEPTPTPARLFTLTRLITPGGSPGRIDCDPPGEPPGEYLSGTRVNCTANGGTTSVTPYTNFRFDHWELDCASWDQTATCELVITSDTRILAFFVESRIPLLP